MSDDIFDFGFTAVDEDELEIAQEAEQLAETSQTTQETLDKLYNAIIPLLNNLKLNPEKEYIKWPNRQAKVEAFEKKLLDIYNGNG